jgi:hypothetical protein
MIRLGGVIRITLGRHHCFPLKSVTTPGSLAAWLVRLEINV